MEININININTNFNFNFKKKTGACENLKSDSRACDVTNQELTNKDIGRKKNRAHAKKKQNYGKIQKLGQGQSMFIPKTRKACKWGMAAAELTTININKPEQPVNRATAPMT